jgi:membrane protein
LNLQLAERAARARDFLRDDLWNAQPDPGTWTGRGLSLLQFAVMTGEGFVRDHLLLRASALTYFTVLSLVPMLAIVVAFVNLFGASEDLAVWVVQQIAAGSPEAQTKIIEVVESASSNLHALGVLGAVLLLVTSVLGISNVEGALNGIWGVKKSRTLARRLPDYLAVLLIAPLLLLVALSLKTTLETQFLVQQLLEVPFFATAQKVGLQQAPTVLLAVAFAFLYWFLPNTSVRLSAALLGGVVAGVLVTQAQTLYLDFSIGAARANALYAGFAQLPLLLVWIYFFWAIVLFGAEIAFAYQNLELYRREVRGRRAGPAEREAIGLRIALEVARAFRAGDPVWEADALSDALRVPVRTVRDVVAQLEADGILAPRGSGGREEGFQLGRPADTIQIIDVLAALRGLREPITSQTEISGAVEALLAELREGEAKSAAGDSLSDVLGRIGGPGSVDRPEPRG